VLVAYLGLLLQGGCLLALGDFHFHHDPEPDRRRRRHLFVSLLLWLLSWFTAFDAARRRR
jgi:hypothetical protein